MRIKAPGWIMGSLILVAVCLAAFVAMDLIFGAPMNVGPRPSRAHADLRSLALAMEAYRIDHGVYPAGPNGLTTPLAYIAEIPLDHFAREEGRRLTLLREVARYRFYSVGPDGVDDRASRVYDSTNGTESPGDLIWFGPEREMWAAEFPEAMWGSRPSIPE